MDIQRSTGHFKSKSYMKYADSLFRNDIQNRIFYILNFRANQFSVKNYGQFASAKKKYIKWIDGTFKVLQKVSNLMNKSYIFLM